MSALMCNRATICAADPRDQDVFNTIKDSLEFRLKEKQHRSVAPTQQMPQHSPVVKELRVKCEFQGEKRVMQIGRPVRFSNLTDKIRQYYHQDLKMFYTTTSQDVTCLLLDQKDLDTAINLVDQNERMHSLRLRLVKETDSLPPGRLGELFGGAPTVHVRSKSPVLMNDNNNSKSRCEPHRIDRDSPPPGTLPKRELYRSASRVSCGSEGQFIPEDHQDELGDPLSPSSSLSGSQSSFDSCLPHRGKGSLRSVKSDTGTYPEYEESHSRGRSTFPRSANRTSTLSYDRIPQGSQSFPFHGKNTDFSVGHLHEQMSTLSSQGISTSSSSSGRGTLGSNSPALHDQLSAYKRAASRNHQRSPQVPLRWEKGRILGSGAFGQVYLCHCMDSGRELAVKQVHFGDRNSEISKE
ncbi:hypothetical protein CAPTEDRAFT_195803, partial [Capitella teleta]